MNAVACQAWPWVLHWRRQGAELAQRLDETLAAVADCGYGAWEQDLPQSAGERETLGEGLRRHKLGMPSAYLNAPLHRGDWPAQVEAIALHCREAKVLGLQVLVLNPTPLSWDEALDKSKPEMQAQSAALDQLGAALQGQGQVLAYHIHSAEMRRDAREFRSTLAGTQRSHVGLCLEPQWMFEGAGDETLLRQTCQAYARDIRCVHFRQSRQGRPCAALESGDIDYAWIWERLLKAGYGGPLVMEGFETDGTADPQTFRACLRSSRQWIRALTGS